MPDPEKPAELSEETLAQWHALPYSLNPYQSRQLIDALRAALAKESSK